MINILPHVPDHLKPTRNAIWSADQAGTHRKLRGMQILKLAVDHIFWAPPKLRLLRLAVRVNLSPSFNLWTTQLRRRSCALIGLFFD